MITCTFTFSDTSIQGGHNVLPHLRFHIQNFKLQEPPSGVVIATLIPNTHATYVPWEASPSPVRSRPLWYCTRVRVPTSAAPVPGLPDIKHTPRCCASRSHTMSLSTVQIGTTGVCVCGGGVSPHQITGSTHATRDTIGGAIPTNRSESTHKPICIAIYDYLFIYYIFIYLLIVGPLFVCV